MTENNDFNNTENEKRYKVNIDHHKTSRNYVTGILDCETNVLLDNHTAINNRLNKQNEIISKLKTDLKYETRINNGKRFELIPNLQGQVDIVDHVESEEKNAICIYNDLGVLPFTSAPSLCDLLNELNDECDFLEIENEALEDGATKYAELYHKSLKENEKLTSVNQELRNELKFDEKMYKTFKEIIDEADDLITSHLSKHYQRQWKNFCKHRGVLDD